MYKFKILKLSDSAEWCNAAAPKLGAGPNIKGSVLMRRVYVEVSNDATKLFETELLVDDPITPERFAAAVGVFEARLPVRDDLEGIVALVSSGNIAIYRDGVELKLKGAKPSLTAAD